MPSREQDSSCLGRTQVRSPNGTLAALSGSLIYLDDFPALVKATLGTDAMLHAWLLAVGAGDGLRCPQGIVGSSFAATRF
jgi:hypothetical protein